MFMFETIEKFLNRENYHGITQNSKTYKHFYPLLLKMIKIVPVTKTLSEIVYIISETNPENLSSLDLRMNGLKHS